MFFIMLSCLSAEVTFQEHILKICLDAHNVYFHFSSVHAAISAKQQIFVHVIALVCTVNRSCLVQIDLKAT